MCHRGNDILKLMYRCQKLLMDGNNFFLEAVQELVAGQWHLEEEVDQVGEVVG